MNGAETTARVPRPLVTAAAISWRGIVVAAAVVAVVYALVELRLVVLPVIVALFATTVLLPPARRLERRGLPPAAASLAVLVGSALAVAGLFALVGPTVADELEGLGQNIGDGVDEATRFLTSEPLNLSRQQIDDAIDQAGEQLRASSGVITQRAVRGALLIGELIAGLLLAAVLVFFFIKDGDRIWRWLVNLFPPAQRPDVDGAGRRAWHTLSGYLRGIAVVALVDTALIGLVLVILGVPLVPALMLLTFIGAFFPLIGATLAGLVATLVALAANGVVTAAIVLAAIVVIQQVEGDVLYPYVVGRALEVHPVAILLALTAGAVLGGVAGAFLAVPVAAVVNTVGSYLRAGGASGESPAGDELPGSAARAGPPGAPRQPG